MSFGWAIATAAMVSVANHGTAADLARASRSFSSYHFETPLPQPGLRIANPRECRESGECDYIDALGVHHFTGHDHELAVKSVDLRNYKSDIIHALGIGHARRQRDVVRRVTAFLRGVRLDCTDGGNEGGQQRFSCGATLGKGWITLRFDRKHQLTEARIDAYHFT